MHFILGLLGTIVFLWKRRHEWRKRYEGNPAFQIEDPLDATAILMVAIAKVDGDMTRETKSLILKLYETKLKLSKKEAAGLLISSSHLLADGVEVRTKVEKFLEPSLNDFTEAKAASSIELIEQVAKHEPTIHPDAQKLLDEIKPILLTKRDATDSW